MHNIRKMHKQHVTRMYMYRAALGKKSQFAYAGREISIENLLEVSDHGISEFLDVFSGSARLSTANYPGEFSAAYIVMCTKPL